MIPVLIGWMVAAVLMAWYARRGRPVMRLLCPGLVTLGYMGILLSIMLLLASFVFFVAGLSLLAPLALLTLLLFADGLATAWGSKLAVWLTRLPAALVGPLLLGLVIWRFYSEGEAPGASVETFFSLMLLPWLVVSLGLVGQLTLLEAEAAADAPRATE